MGIKDSQQFCEYEQRALARVAAIADKVAPDITAIRRQLGARVADIAFGAV